MNAPKLLLALPGALGLAAIVPTNAAAGVGVLVKIDNRMKRSVSCTVHRKDNNANVTPRWWRSVAAKTKANHVFVAPDQATKVYFMCGPSGEKKKMRLYFDTANARTHHVDVGCYNAGGCIANQRKKKKSSGGGKA